jgi:ESX secretion-associated protein EspG
MLSDSVVLNLTTVHALVRWRQAEPHPVLTTIPAWYDEDTRHAMDRHALGELEQNRLLRRGRPSPDLDDTVAALIRPYREHYGWLTTTVDGRPFRYGLLAVATYQEAVLAIRNHDADTVMLSTIQPNDLTSAFLAQLPAVPAASGRSVSTPYQDFLAATEPPGDGFTGFDTRQSPELRAITAILTRPRTGGGSLYTANRNGSVGTRRRARHPLNYLDTPTGRWLTQLDDTTAGLTVTLRPATTEVLAAGLTDPDGGPPPADLARFGCRDAQAQPAGRLPSDLG